MAFNYKYYDNFIGAPRGSASTGNRGRGHIHGLSASRQFGGYKTAGVDFDGWNDYITRGAELTGNADGKEFIISVWFKINNVGSATDRVIQSNPTANSRILGFIIDNDGAVGSLMRNSSAGTVIHLDSAANTYDDGAWHHFLISSNMASAGSGKMYVDDVDVGTEITFTDDTIDFTGGDLTIGAQPISTGKDNLFDGCLADLYINYATSLDLTVEANRRKFIDAAGKPVDLGSDGSTPTDTAPIVFLKADADTPTNFANNLGTGGNFSAPSLLWLTGSITNASSSPSD